MNRILLTLIIAIFICGCSDNKAQKAEELLTEARNLLEQGNLDAARATVDSIRKNYPDLVEVRKQVLALHQSIELKRAQDELAKTDSLLQIANKELEEMQIEVDKHKKALKATPEELTLLTQTRMKRDSIRTQYETLGAKIRYIHQKQKE